MAVDFDKIKNQKALLKEVDAEIKKREDALGLQQKMLELMKQNGASQEAIAQKEEKINKLKEAGNNLSESRVKLEDNIAAAIEQQETNMNRLAAVGGLFMAALQKTQDMLKENSDLVRQTATTLNMNVKEAQAVSHEIGQQLVDGRQDLTNREEVVVAMQAMRDASITGRDVSAETAVNMAIQSKQLGISVESASNFADMMFTTSGHSAETSNNFLNGLKSLSKMSGVGFNKVMADIDAHGKSIASTFGKSAEEIGIMAIEARKLGFELGDVEGMARQLYDTESRIENQMTLNQVLQKNMNFDKAAQLMAEGKTVEAMEEYKKQLGDTTKLSAYERQLVQDKLGINLYNMENAAAIAEETQATADAEQAINDKKAELLEMQLEEFELKATEREEAATQAEEAANRENERNKKLAEMVDMETERLNLAQNLQYVQLAIQGIMAVSAIAGAMLSKSQKENLRSSIATKASEAVNLGLRAASAVASMTAMSAATLGIGMIVTLAAVATGVALLNREKNKAMTDTGDLGIDPNGGPVVMSPREGGIYQGTRNDGVTMSPHHGVNGGPGGGGSNKELLDKMDELIRAVRANRTLSVDGYQLNEATHLEKIPSGMA